VNWKVPEAVRTASFCGIAAANVKGGTLSAMFGWSIFSTRFNSASKPKPSQEATRKEFQPCAILIIDEVSTLTQGHFGLLDTSLRLLRPNEHDQPAGGFNLLLIGIVPHTFKVGDFLQLGPMSGARIFSVPLQEEKDKQLSLAKRELLKGKETYTEVQHKKKVANIDENWINREKGYRLYQRITYVVTLTENWRHRLNPSWVQILNRWRRGVFTDEDVAYANSTCKSDGI
jgi:hypothetical protein